MILSSCISRLDCVESKGRIISEKYNGRKWSWKIIDNILELNGECVKNQKNISKLCVPNKIQTRYLHNKIEGLSTH